MGLSRLTLHSDSKILRQIYAIVIGPKALLSSRGQRGLEVKISGLVLIASGLGLVLVLVLTKVVLVA